MRADSGYIYNLWTAGGPFIGSGGKPHSRVTVEIGWTLGEWTTPVGDFDKPPLRWFQLADDSQVETEVPNVESINIERSIDQDAATCTIQLTNTKMPVLGVPNLNAEEFGEPGYLTFSRGSSTASLARWNHAPNEWEDVLVPNALIRTYQGFGGTTKTLAQAQADGNIIQTGIWLVDEVRISTGGKLELQCRDMGKLLIDQPLYPPLVPMFDANGCDVYPLRYQRYYTLRGTQSRRIAFGDYTQTVNGDNPSGRKIFGIEYAPSTSVCHPGGEGYWLAGDDGGVFTYGYIHFHGSRAGLPLNEPVRGMTGTKTNNGYWLVGADGGIFSYGDAEFYGSVPGDSITITNAVALERSSDGDGYFVAGADGGVYSYGDAIFDGSGVGTVVGNVVAMDVFREPGQSGYWLCTEGGYVYAFGDAGYYGGLDGSEGNTIVGFAASPTGLGYYLLKDDGAIYTYGDAVYFGSPAEDGIVLNDPATDLAVHPDGTGYWIAAEDGGVFTYGTLNFYGSLPGPWVNLALTDGNYVDYSDIVKDILLWSGFWLNDGGVSPEPYASIESTGIYNNEGDGALPDDLFDKKPGIDVINQLKAVVGYIFWIDEMGAAHFESPNWWAPGNFLETGLPTATIPEIDEEVHLTQYGISYNDTSMRSRIVIASYQPSAGLSGTVITDKASVNAGALRGLEKPMMWVNQTFASPEEQEVMAELIDLHINFQRRLGSVTCVANPLLQINDQVRILERETSETYVHYVRSISSTHNLKSGEYMMTLTTNWLGDSGAWAIYTPSVLVQPDPIETSIVIPTPTVSTPIAPLAASFSGASTTGGSFSATALRMASFSGASVTGGELAVEALAASFSGAASTSGSFAATTFTSGSMLSRGFGYGGRAYGAGEYGE